MRWSAGRLDFAALQHRMVAGHRGAEQLARTQPCHYVVFDVLRVRGRDMMARPLIERRKVLEKLFTSVPAAGVLALGMQTADESEARAWYGSLHLAGVEGLVIKPARSRYEPSAQGWLKLKYRSTTEAIVGGLTGDLRRPDRTIPGRRDCRRRGPAGSTDGRTPSATSRSSRAWWWRSWPMSPPSTVVTGTRSASCALAPTWLRRRWPCWTTSSRYPANGL
ncbi:hypothetical protein [Nonomuraea sp. NPDC050786]|uniref:ATP-dependent DNA ligase n=1 Tax=Nonomuraea sp. NPDC050786 TaxID=3154840 RepID=UPI0033D0E2E9